MTGFDNCLKTAVNYLVIDDSTITVGQYACMSSEPAHVCERAREDFLFAGCLLPAAFGPVLSVTEWVHIWTRSAALRHIKLKLSEFLWASTVKACITVTNILLPYYQSLRKELGEERGSCHHSICLLHFPESVLECGLHYKGYWHVPGLITTPPARNWLLPPVPNCCCLLSNIWQVKLNTCFNMGP